jgi:site-specific recombinase XerD
MIYDPVARRMLQKMRCRRVRVQIDRVQIKQRQNVLMMSLPYRKRAIPLAWIGTGIPTEVIRQNLGHADVKTTQDYIGVLDGSTRAPVSVYDASLILEKIETMIPRN